MAELALAAIGSAIGSAMAVEASAVVFAGMTAAQIGWMAGSLIGAAVFNQPPDQQGPRVQDTKTDAGAYGANIHRLWGIGVVTGESIWVSDLIETKHVDDHGNFVTDLFGMSTQTTNFTYAANMLTRLCASPRAGKTPHVRRIWANSVLIYDSQWPLKTDQRYITEEGVTILYGDDDQMPHSTYEAAVGIGRAPAHRGYITVALDGLQLSEAFGNRIPVIKAEVITAATASDAGFKAEIIPTPWETMGFDWTWYNPETGELWVMDYDTAGEYYPYHFTHPIRRIDPVTGADLGIPDTPIDAEPYDEHDGGQFYNPTTKEFVVVDVWGEGTQVFPTILIVLLRYSAVTGEYLGRSSHNFYWPHINPFSGVMFATSLYNDYEYYKLNSDFSIAETWNFLPIFSPWPNGQRITFTDANTGWLYFDGELYRIDLGTGAWEFKKKIGYDEWSGDIIGAKDGVIWFVNDFSIGKYVIATDGYTEQSVAPAGSYIQAWPDMDNDIVYFSVYNPVKNAYTGLTAYDFNTSTVLHAEAGGGYVYHVNVTPKGMYWSERTFSGEWVLHRWQPAPSSVTTDLVPLREVVEDVSLLCGLQLSDLDTTDMDEWYIHGYSVSGMSTGRAMLSQLIELHSFDAYRSGGKITFRYRGKPSTATLTMDDFLEDPEGKNPVFEAGSAHETPVSVMLGFTERGTIEYGQSTVQVGLQTTPGVGMLSYQTALAMTVPEARALAWKILAAVWSENIKIKRSVSPRWAHLEPGDAVIMPAGSGTRWARIKSITEEGIRRRLELVTFDPATLNQAVTGNAGTRGWDQAIPALGTAQPVLVDCAPISNSARALVLYVAAVNDSLPTWVTDMFGDSPPGWVVQIYGSQFKGGIVQKSYDGESWIDVGRVFSAAPSGFTKNDIGHSDGHEGWIDREHVLELEKVIGKFDTISEFEMLGGGNIVWMGQELIQYANATLIGDKKYALSNLLRNVFQRPVYTGTLYPLRATALTRGGVLRVPMARTDIGKTIKFRVIANGQAVNDATINEITYQGHSMRPRAPTFVRAARDDNNDFTVTWVRRNLRDLGWYDGKDMPVEEKPESYRVQIWDGLRSVVLREVEVYGHDWTYLADEQVEDLGVSTGPIRYSIAMYSEFFAGYEFSEIFEGEYP